MTIDQARSKHEAVLILRETHKAAVQAEFFERGSHGRLWTYGQCAAWHQYEQAIADVQQAEMDLIKALGASLDWHGVSREPEYPEWKDMETA